MRTIAMTATVRKGAQPVEFNHLGISTLIAISRLHQDNRTIADTSRHNSRNIGDTKVK